MNQKEIIIDIGSENFKFFLLSEEKGGVFRVLKSSNYPSEGVKFGIVSNYDLFLKSLKKSFQFFTKEIGFRPEEVSILLGGYGMRGVKINSILQLADRNNISSREINLLREKAEKNFKTDNSEIIEKIELKYILDGQEHYSKPIGLEAKKIEAEYLYIILPKNNLKLIEEAFSELDILISSISPSILASSESALSFLDKKMGSALVDLGHETISIIIFENNKPIHFNILKGGFENISKRISVEFQIDYSKADKIKKTNILERKYKKIIDDEIEKIASIIDDEINKIGKGGVLPAGIILVGGGSRYKNIEEIFRKKISLPVKKAQKNNSDFKMEYHLAYGALSLLKKDEENVKVVEISRLKENIIKIKNKVLKIFSRFLP